MPINKFLDYVFGNVKIKVDAKDTEKCINILHRNKILAGEMQKDKEGYFSFSIRYRKLKDVKCLLDKSGIKVYSIKGKGLPFLFKLRKKRYGLALGAVIFCLSIWVSNLFVWDLTFSGNENIPDKVVEEQLIKAGFGVGTYIPKIDFYKLCNVFLQQTEDFSFVSVNMEGTTAHIELRERKKEDEREEYKASNIVAKYSGQIDSMTVYSGNAVIGKEAVVKKGDLLVSGFLEKMYGFEIVRSSGSVYAYVTRTFDVEIPFEKQTKVYTGKTNESLSFAFFGKDFSIYSNKGDSLTDYDETIDRERLVLFDRVKLPLILTKSINKEYKLENITLSEEEARQEAENEMSRILLEELYDSEVLERRTSFEVTENSFNLSCEVFCLTDIALEKEIKMN